MAVTVEQCWQPVPGGSGTYVVELTHALASLAPGRVVGVAARHGGPAPLDWRPGVPVRHSRLPRRVLYDAWQHLPAPRAERLVGGADVVHATTWAVPATRRPLVVTVHDLAFLHDPTHFTGRGNAWFRRALEQTRRAADVVVVPSESTAADCVAAGLPGRSVHVVPHGVHRSDVTNAQVADWRARYGVDRDYVLWCGTVEPRKDLPTLLAAFARAARELPDVDLVLVGPQGWGSLPRVPAGLPEDRLHVLGHLPRTDLEVAYAGASVFCFPSVREGFGLPVLEAMAAGVPVVTTRGTACAEVAGDAGLLADAGDVAQFAAGLVEAHRSRADLSRLARERAAGYSWAEAARRTHELYVTAASDRRTSR